MVGDIGHVGRAEHAAYFLERLHHAFRAAVEFAPFGRVVDIQIALDSSNQAHDLFLANLHAPPDATIRTDRFPGGLDQIRTAEQEARGLRPKQALAPGKDHHVEALLDIVTQPIRGRDIRRGVVHGRNAMRLRHFDPFRAFQLAQPIRLVEEEHHGRAIVECPLQFLPRLNPNRLGSDQLHLGLVAGPMRLLLDDLVLHPCRIRQAGQLLIVARSDRSGSSAGNRGRCAAGNHRRWNADELGDAVASLHLQLTQRNKMLRGLEHGVDDLGRHDRTAQDRHRADTVDHRFDADPPIYVRRRGSSGPSGPLAGSGGPRQRTEFQRPPSGNVRSHVV